MASPQAVPIDLARLRMCFPEQFIEDAGDILRPDLQPHVGHVDLSLTVCAGGPDPKEPWPD
jgi:hypothetical protein